MGSILLLQAVATEVQKNHHPEYPALDSFAHTAINAMDTPLTTLYLLLFLVVLSFIGRLATKRPPRHTDFMRAGFGLLITLSGLAVVLIFLFTGPPPEVADLSKEAVRVVAMVMLVATVQFGYREIKTAFFLPVKKLELHADHAQEANTSAVEIDDTKTSISSATHPRRPRGKK